MLITGFLFLYASENILNVVSMVFITGLALLQTWLTYKQLKENNWKFTMVRDRLYLSIILIVLSIFLFVKDHAMFIMGSVIFSISAFVLATWLGMKAADKTTPFIRRILSGAESVLCIIYGISFMIIPQEAVFGYTLSIGYFLIGDALIRLLLFLFDTMKNQK